MRVTGILQKTAIFGALGVALSIIPTAGVSASATSASGQRELNDSCVEWDDYEGQVRVFYTPNGYADVVDEIKYWLGAENNRDLGKKSNVRLRIRESLADRPDKTLWEWNSGDNVKPGWHKEKTWRQVDYKKRWHVDAKFVFDVGGIDPKCTATTGKA
ncbi:hypothetical protein [Nonomuraea sp. NPDC049480]|uniref:hypothetical protein n=1 Tax=Nonomuraea sp. NPDC049480 TaxID=3364353 RepID=UPI00378F3DE6